MIWGHAWDILQMEETILRKSLPELRQASGLFVMTPPSEGQQRENRCGEIMLVGAATAACVEAIAAAMNSAA
jgi:hypothetical protein